MTQQEINLFNQTIALAKALKQEANRLDMEFTRTCDPRALQGGANCQDADDYRAAAKTVFAVARELPGRQ